MHCGVARKNFRTEAKFRKTSVGFLGETPMGGLGAKCLEADDFTIMCRALIT